MNRVGNIIQLIERKETRRVPRRLSNKHKLNCVGLRAPGTRTICLESRNEINQKISLDEGKQTVFQFVSTELSH